MQAIRNVLFCASPLLGAVIGGVIGLSYNAFIWLFEVLIGFGLGILMSIVMIVLSIRARFRSDPSLTRVSLEKDSGAASEPR